jgi:hypothetical protein
LNEESLLNGKTRKMSKRRIVEMDENKKTGLKARVRRGSPKKSSV